MTAALSVLFALALAWPTSRLPLAALRRLDASNPPGSADA